MIPARAIAAVPSPEELVGSYRRFGDFGPGLRSFHHGGHLSAAAEYLGLTVPALLQRLASGKSLSDFAL